MTCIVGLIDGQGNVWIGGDSAGVGGYMDLTIRKDPKVFRNGNFVIGGTTSFRMLQLLRFSFVPPEYFPERDKDLDKFKVVNVIDAIRTCLKNGGFATSDRGQEAGGRFLIGFQGHLYTVDNDYQVGEALRSYDAVGCGCDYANGALYAMHDMDPRERIELALKAAEAHNAGVRAPFVIECLEAAK